MDQHRPPISRTRLPSWYSVVAPLASNCPLSSQ
jgi:hypothetical protein